MEMNREGKFPKEVGSEDEQSKRKENGGDEGEQVIKMLEGEVVVRNSS